MPNAAAQLVVDPLFRRGIFFFRGGIGEDVLGNLFSSKDFFRKQVKTGKSREEKNMRLPTRARNGLTENSLSNGTLLWWSAALLDRLLSLVFHGFGVFSSETRGEDVKLWKCMRVDLQGTQGAILLPVRAHWE
jgi:hypothetical protein